MILKKIIGIVSGVILLSASNVTTNQPTQLLDFKPLQTKSVLNDNKQVYLANDNTNHTVYWAKGIDAPLMSGDPKMIDGSQENYFRLIEQKDSNGKLLASNYAVGLETDRGFFDLNKDFEKRPIETSTCYLNAGLNNILWWLNQNKPYILQYMDHLKNDDAFGSEFGLVKVLPYNQQTWDDFFMIPKVNVNSQNLLSQELGTSKQGEYTLATKYFTGYYNRGDGFATDYVFDFFFNGYLSQANNTSQSLLDENKEEDYRMDPLGGYFQPIFGKHRLGKRHTKMTYSYVKDLLKDSLQNNMAMTFSYYGASNYYSHAITLWGAEYDEEGELVRIFVTDSDDYGERFPDTDEAVTLHSFEVLKDKGADTFRIGSIPGNEKDGSYLQQITTLSLAQDIWEEKLNDLEPPLSPFIEVPEDVTTALGGTKYLEISATGKDSGYLTYQWYVANQLNGVGEKLSNGTSPKVKVKTESLGEKYYYCVVSNHKNGKRLDVKTRYIKVTINNDPLVNALPPIIKVNMSEYPVYYQINEKAKDFVVTATSPDNGILSYQWYTTTQSSASGGSPIKGATSNVLKINTSYPGRQFYYCVVTNYNPNANGIQSVSKATKIAYRIEVESYADDYARAFLAANVCGTSDTTPAMSQVFLKMRDKFNQEMTSSFTSRARKYLETAKGDQNSDDPVRQMLAKYDRIIALHGEDEVNFPDFLNRKGTPAFTYPLGVNQLSDDQLQDNIVYLIVAGLIVVVMSVVTIVFVFVNHKRKEK